MDYLRGKEELKRSKRHWRWGIPCILVGILIIIWVFAGLSQNQNYLVERDSVFIGVVELGVFELDARGLGTLVPEYSRWISSESAGVVEQVYLLPGAKVEEGTFLLQLSNSELELELKSATRQLISTQAEYENKVVAEEDKILEMEFQLVQLQGSLENARMDLKSYSVLHEKGIVPDRTVAIYRVQVEQLEKQTTILQGRLETRRERSSDSLAPYQLLVEQEKERVSYLEQQMQKLSIRAPQKGVLRSMDIEEGERVDMGQPLAQIVDASSMKGEVKIPEYQAKHLEIGQKVRVDTRSSWVHGTVSRVDPKVVDGSVTIDVRFSDALPDGLRVDSTLSAIVQIDKVEDTLFVEKPVGARDNIRLQLWVVSPDGAFATRKEITFGRMSTQTIEVLDGLKKGDRVVLSDTHDWAELETVYFR